VVTGEKFTGAVDLVIEVLSPGSANRRRDIVAKRDLYEKYGVEEYWIVDTEHQSVSIFRQSDGALTETGTFSKNERITSSILTRFQIVVETIFEL
jgi:Uma2 family endonuclease